MRDNDGMRPLDLAPYGHIGGGDLIEEAIARDRANTLRIVAWAAIGMLSCASIAELGVFFAIPLMQFTTIGLVGVIVTAAIIGAVSGAVIASACTPARGQQAPALQHAV